MIATTPSLDPFTVERMLTDLDRAVGTRSKALVRELTAIGLALESDRIDLGDQLDAGWEYLERLPDTQRETIWIDWLADYERTCDLQSRIAHRALGNHPETVTTRKEE